MSKAAICYGLTWACRNFFNVLSVDGTVCFWRTFLNGKSALSTEKKGPQLRLTLPAWYLVASPLEPDSFHDTISEISILHPWFTTLWKNNRLFRFFRRRELLIQNCDSYPYVRGVGHKENPVCIISFVVKLLWTLSKTRIVFSGVDGREE